MKFEIVQHGAEHEQYFQGAGVFGTEYKEIVTGVGATPRDAGNDALEQFHLCISNDRADISVEEVTALEVEIEKLSETDDAHAGCVEAFRIESRVEDVIIVYDSDAWEKYHENCEVAHRVSIRWSL